MNRKLSGRWNRFRPRFDILETRLALAVSITQGDFDNNGTTDLRIIGDDLSQRVFLSEDPIAGTTFLDIDANGDGDVTDPGDTDDLLLGEFETVSMALGDGADRVSLSVDDLFIGERRSYLIDLGESTTPGQNLLASFRSFEGGSSVSLEVKGGSLDDFISVASQSLIASAFSSAFSMTLDVGAGDNTIEIDANAAANIFVSDGATLDIDIETDPSNGPGQDTVEFAMGILATTGGSVSINAQLFGGDDTFTAEFGNGTLQVGDAAAGLTGFNLSVDGGDGNDIIRTSLDTTKCAVADTGYCRFDFRGGSGTDLIELIQPTTTNTGRMLLRGLWEVFLEGGRGKDTINVDLNERPATGDLDLRAPGVFRLSARGGHGADAITVNLSNGQTGTVAQGAYDVALFGNKGNDTITFNLDIRARVRLALDPGGAILFDGGLGTADVLNLSGTGTVTTRSRNLEL